MDLSPAKWIWLPSERCLPNTFILFRHKLKLAARPARAQGWLTADSRYRLTVNGQRIQWGPAPCDPRWPEVDPFDITHALRAGDNVIGVEVCYFGQGDGTWPMGAPGFILLLEVDSQLVVSDATWQTFLDRAHRPGMYKRWFLRALQEEFDARLHPAGGHTPGYRPDARWLPARELPGPATTPAIFAGGPEYVLGCDQPGSQIAELRPRSIPLMREQIVPAKQLTESGRVTWLRDPNDWFESRVPGSFEIVRDESVVVNGVAELRPPAPKETLEGGALRRHSSAGRGSPDPALPDDRRSPGFLGDLTVTPAAGSGDPRRAGLFLTFEMPEHLVGFPRFTIDAPAGTIVELIVRESHDPAAGPAWLENYIHHWARFICREGVNEFETFDYESFQWLQLHIRNAARPVTVRDIGARRRVYAWPNPAEIRCSEPALQRLFEAGVNTLYNCAQETNQDGGGRERQQYSGDCGHQQHAIRYAFGEVRHGARYLQTFSQGMTLDGYFLDCWPAFDRLARLMQRQIGTTVWGPILDHGVGLNFDCWNHYLESGDLDALREPYPRLKRFAEYLKGLRRDDGLLPVENIGVPTVWIDHWSYQHQAHKQCAFNLYAAAMFQHALAKIAAAFGDDPQPCRQLGAEIQQAAVARFWDQDRRLFVCSRPPPIRSGRPLFDDRSVSEKPDLLRTDDRSLATAILFDQCPGNDTAAALQTLVACPPTMGLSYPANAVWRYWALAKCGRADVIVRDFRERWATMESVIYNNALQEVWDAKRDTNAQFSHCPLAPLVMLYQCVAGIRPTAPGFARCEIRPQLADLGDLHLVAHTPRGPITFTATREQDKHAVKLRVPETCEATLLLPSMSPRRFERDIDFVL